MNIITALQNSDELMFRQVFDDYHKKVYVKIKAATASQYLAEEVMQLTFIKLWESRHTLSESYALSTQIFRIASTTLIDLLRKQTSNDKKIAAKQRQPLSAYNNILEQMAEKEIHSELNKALATLPATKREVFEMSRLNGMSYKEIACRLAITEKAVENHIYKASKQVRYYLSAEYAICMLSIIYFCIYR